jgi:hypothetical protein
MKGACKIQSNPEKKLRQCCLRRHAWFVRDGKKLCLPLLFNCQSLGNTHFTFEGSIYSYMHEHVSCYLGSVFKCTFVTIL